MGAQLPPAGLVIPDPLDLRKGTPYCTPLLVHGRTHEKGASKGDSSQTQYLRGAMPVSRSNSGMERGLPKPMIEDKAATPARRCLVTLLPYRKCRV